MGAGRLLGFAFLLGAGLVIAAALFILSVFFVTDLSDSPPRHLLFHLLSTDLRLAMWIADSRGAWALGLVPWVVLAMGAWQASRGKPSAVRWISIAWASELLWFVCLIGAETWLAVHSPIQIQEVSGYTVTWLFNFLQWPDLVQQSSGRLLPFALALFVAWFAQARAERFFRYLKHHGDGVCPGCVYPLQGLPAQSKCPECGRTYDLAEVADHWRKMR